jgi:error-prone DNA polymerase
MTPPAYAELDLISNFSFLEGGSHPAELVTEARRLGLAAIGLADRNTLAGVVRAHAAAKAQGLRLLIGCRLAFVEDGELIVYPRDRAAYGRLCRLLSIGKSGVGEVSPPAPPAEPGAVEDRIPKAETRLSFAQAAALGEGMIALARAPAVIDEAFEARLTAWRRAWPDDLHLAAAPGHGGDDRARLARLAALAGRAGAPLVATNAVLYHQPERRPLQDVLSCIREGVTLERAGFRLQANAERHLKPAAEMARLFRGHEDALARGLAVADACRFSLDELKYEYPHEPTPPGRTAQQHLRRLSFQGLRARFPDGVPAKVLQILKKELRLIARVKYAPYFLTVHDIVQWARAPERGILCQGRGSAANSVVCYCLGITSVDPSKQDVLFERFISEERSEPPDIDVDFEHERREQVMQYVYARYGRHRAAICATVIHYRPRSAIRDVGKALGLTEDVTAMLAGTVWGSYGARVEAGDVDRTLARREDPRLALALDLTAELIGFPRHLSQHVGGFVLTEGPLVETVPVGNAAMADRTFIEWDKDDIDGLKIMKVDVLALGMLSAIRRAFALIETHHGESLDLASVPREAPEVYDMLCKADSLGVFQVESRAQMNMLPRLQPREFYDLVVQVAIVRPGPIQGDMVHPYLRGRAERRAAQAAGRPFRIQFPSPAPECGPPDELERVLGKTLGVPLFQEQAMRIAMVAAEFSGDEANGLRRAMATFRHMGTIHTYEEKMVGRMVRRGYDPVFAANCFNQIKGFGDYGFPESHAAAFAQLVYVSAWIKCFHPEVFACALLNSQPMGFYAPAQIVRDAREHGVEIRPPDVNASDWDCTLEGLAPSPSPLVGEGGARAQRAWEDEGSRQPVRPSDQHASEIRRGRAGATPHPPMLTHGPLLLPQGEKDSTPLALRLGLRQIDGFREAWARALETARAQGGPFGSMDDLRLRATLPAAALDALAAADALGSLGLARRPGLWAARGLPRAAPAPLFAAVGLEEADDPPPPTLPAAPLSEEVVDDYQTLRLSLKAHPLSFLRERLARAGVTRARDIDRIADGARATAAGVVLVRQRPGSAKGVVFLTLEDETGVVNVVVWPKVFERQRPVVMGARLVLVRGRIQRAPDSEGRVTHLVAETLEDRTADLALLSDAGLKPTRGDGPTGAAPERGEPQARRHPRDVRVLPKSRDFH